MKQILIVEDDSFLNKMVAYNLTADGYGVTSALNARTAAEAIRQREFDLVLLDINLPDGNGFELCKLIKPQHPDTIVIFLTANDQESDQIRGYEVGAVDYITKPFVIGALQRKIKARIKMEGIHQILIARDRILCRNICILAPGRCPDQNNGVRIDGTDLFDHSLRIRLHLRP